MIRIVVADNHAMIREGLKHIISSSGDMTVVGEAADGAGVMQLVRGSDFEMLVLDLSMPGRSGMELIKLVRSEKPRLRILVFSMHQELQYAARAIKSGANGYLIKDSAPLEVLEALRKIAAGRHSFSPDVTEQLLLGSMRADVSVPHERLSDREFEVFRLIASGVSVTDIALRLNLSAKTISTHKANLMQKMDMHNQSELIRYAIKHGVAEPPEP
jgi:DNA-binding NarL/FixJ family response regulator